MSAVPLVWVATALAGQDVAWQTSRLACFAGDATECMAIDYVEEACELGDLEGCARQWGDEGPRPWEALRLVERCESEPEACALLEEHGWTLPFRRLAESNEPVFVGPMRFVDGGGVLMVPSGDLEARLYDPALGALVGTTELVSVEGLERSRQQESYTAEGDGYRAELERGELRIHRGEEEVATLRGALPLSPMAISGGRLVVGGRLVFDLDPQPTDVSAMTAWLAALPTPEEPSNEAAAIEVIVEGAEGPVEVHLYDTLVGLGPIRVQSTVDGVARFDGLDAGFYSVQAATAAGGDFGDVQVQGGGVGEETLHLDPERLVSGRVRTRWGRGVEGAVVHVEHGAVLPMESGAGGHVHLPLRLMEDEPGPARVYAVADEGVSASVEIVAGDSVELKLLPYEHRRVLEVLTLGEGGQPVDGVVEVGLGPSLRVADERGATWFVRADDETETLRARWGHKRAETLVPASETKVLVLFSNASVRVAAPAMTCRLETPDGQLLRLAQGSSIRESQTSLLAAGDYVLWHSTSKGMERHAFALEGSQELSLEPPFESAGLTVTGRLVDESGQPLIGVRVSGVRMEGEIGPFDVLTDVDGRFEVVGVLEGPHTFELVQKTPTGWKHYDDLEVDLDEDSTDLGSVLR